MPHLTLVEKGSAKTHRIGGPEALVGRDPTCQIFVEGDEAKTASGRHARFFLDGGKWFVEDAGSRNGTYIGTRRLEPGSRHALAVGDVVGLGLMGTQLSVLEAAGRAVAATLLEAAPPVPSSTPPGNIPARRAEAASARVVDPGGPQIHLSLRNVQSNAVLAGHGNRITIGRSLECIIRVEGDGATSVSRVHAEVTVSNGKAVLRDGGSRHGTLLNGKKIDGPTVMKTGDVLTLGQGGPAFSIEDVTLDGLGHIAGSGDAAASARADDGVFSSELPTPPLGLPATKLPPRDAAASSRRTTTPKKSAMPEARRRKRWKMVTGILIAAGVIVAGAWAALTLAK